MFTNLKPSSSFHIFYKREYFTERLICIMMTKNDRFVTRLFVFNT